MADSIDSIADWRRALPVLTSRGVVLREPVASDVGPLVDLRSLSDAARFGIEEPVTELGVMEFITRATAQRAAGAAFAFVITRVPSRSVVGLVFVRQLEGSFESAEWEATLVPSARGGGVFLETARLIGSFAFGTIGVHRLEARVLLQDGRANGALRKLGAVQEGVLRRAVRRGGTYADQVLWSILKDDWGEHWVSTAPRVH